MKKINIIKENRVLENVAYTIINSLNIKDHLWTLFQNKYACSEKRETVFFVFFIPFE